MAGAFGHAHTLVTIEKRDGTIFGEFQNIQSAIDFITNSHKNDEVNRETT